METQLEQIRDQQKESWDQFSPGWKKWDALMMDFLKPMGDEIIRKIAPKNSDLVLDVASGTGEPGLTIAEMIPNGKVIVTDLSDKMLDIALEKAVSRGITNFEIKASDVSELPFPDNTFDKISCRFGFMFFPDMQRAANEMARVLKPGGKIATSVWMGPEYNFWVTASMGTINRNMELPSPPAGAPGMFRCAEKRFIAEIFEKAGFKNVSDTEVSGSLNVGKAETYWDMMTEVAAPFVAALSKADENMKAKIKSEIITLVNQNFPDGNVMIPSKAYVVSGEKV